MRIHYDHCPVCGQTSIVRVLEAKDHTVSGEQYAIWECASCHLRFTQDVPDAASIAPYYRSDNYISHSDTRKGLINRLYHQVRQITLRQKKQLLIRETGTASGKLLDIGAGTGAFLHTMQAAGWTVTGLEPDAGAREVAASRYQLALEEPSTLFHLPPASFDAITMWHVLEHVHQLQDYLAQIRKLLKQGGTFFLALPNYTAEDARHYGSYWAAYDVPRHLYHFAPEAVRTLLQQHGLELKAMRPMVFDPFYISMLSEQYQHGRSNLVKAVWNGWRSTKKALSNVESASSIIYIAR